MQIPCTPPGGWDEPKGFGRKNYPLDSKDGRNSLTSSGSSSSSAAGASDSGSSDSSCLGSVPSAGFSSESACTTGKMEEKNEEMVELIL